MKKKSLCASLVSLSISLACLAFAAQPVIVAKVNGAPIPLEAVTDMMNRLKAGKGHGAKAPKGKDPLRMEALDRIIFEELAYQKAKADGLNAGPEEVNKRLEDLRARMGGADGLKKALEKEQRTEEGLVAEIERDVLLRRILAREVFDKIALSEDDVAREYEREKEKFVKPEKVVVADVVFFLKPDERASVERAEEIRKKALEDGDGNLSNLAPDGTFIVHEHEIKREKDEELYENAIKLERGELSGVIATGDSLHIIKLKEFSPRKQFTLKEVRGMLERKLEAEARQTRLRQWDAELRKGAVIEILDTGDTNR